MSIINSMTLLDKKKFPLTCFEVYNFYTACMLLKLQGSSCGHQLGTAISGMWEAFKWTTSPLTHYILEPFEITQKTLAFKHKSTQFRQLFFYAHKWQLGYLFLKYLSQTWQAASDLTTKLVIVTQHHSLECIHLDITSGNNIGRGEDHFKLNLFH